MKVKISHPDIGGLIQASVGGFSYDIPQGSVLEVTDKLGEDGNHHGHKPGVIPAELVEILKRSGAVVEPVK